MALALCATSSLFAQVVDPQTRRAFGDCQVWPSHYWSPVCKIVLTLPDICAVPLFS